MTNVGAIALCFMLSTVVGLTSAACNATVLNAVCIAPFTDFNTLFTGIIWTADKLTNACLNFTVADSCTRTRAGCSDTDTAMITSWLPKKYSFGYLCGEEGRSEFLANQACLGVYTAVQLGINSGGKCLPSTMGPLSTICRDWNAQLECITTSVLSLPNCNSDSGVFLAIMRQHLTLPLISVLDPSCVLNVSATYAPTLPRTSTTPGLTSSKSTTKTTEQIVTTATETTVDLSTTCPIQTNLSTTSRLAVTSLTSTIKTNLAAPSRVSSATLILCSDFFTLAACAASLYFRYLTDSSKTII